MTTGETTVLVVLILLLVVGPFVWIVRSLLKYSDETFEPRYQSRTYRTSVQEFFVSVDFGLAILLVVFGIYLVTLLLGPESIGVASGDWLWYAVFVLLVLMCFGAAAHTFYLNFNYWKHTKDRVLNFEPETRTLIVQTSKDKFVIGEGDIERIDVFSNENFENYYAYYQFKLRNGRELIITDRTKGAHAIFDFFNDPLMHRHKRWLPTIHLKQ